MRHRPRRRRTAGPVPERRPRCGGRFNPDDRASPSPSGTNLKASGFDVRTVELRPHPVRIDDEAVLREYLTTVCLGGYLEHMTPQEGAEFVEAVRLAMPEPVLDYMRLEINAVRR